MNMPKSPKKLWFSGQSAKLNVVRLIRPYWKQLALAFVAVLGETFSDVL